jgi:hypothetical protein
MSRIWMRQLAWSLVVLSGCSGAARAETEQDLQDAVREIEGVKLGGTYKIDGAAYACADKGKLMFVERMAGGDKIDQSNAQLIGMRDCEAVDEDAVYTRCQPGGFVFPMSGGRKLYSGYCLKGTTGPVLYIRDDLANPAKSK